MFEYLNTIWWLAGISLLYIGFLFGIATWGNTLNFKKFQPYVYSLTLAIFCTSWAFYGVVQQTITTGWLLAPTYLGAILLITFGWKIIDRIINVAKKENSSTISDFISARYGHSRGIATLVSIFCLIGIIPYIALQLKAVIGSFQLLSGTTAVELNWYSDPTLIVAAVMAIFSILFGTRKVDSSESHQGMMLAIAFESMIKLIAFVAVGLFAVYGVYDGFGDLFSQAWDNPSIRQTMTDYSDPSIYLIHTLIGAIAIIALPRQFHVAVVEYSSPQDLKTARWMFPVYLLLINLFVIPLAFVAILNQDLFPSLSYITLELPMMFQQEGLALLAYIGGLSAGTSMVIIASITLATMMCNEIILPLLIKFKLQENTPDLKNRVLNIRRIAIVFVLILSFMYYRLLSQYHSLSEIGLLSFVAIAQFAPAMLIGLIWQGANRRGAYWGLIVGFIVWTYCLFLPVLANAGWLPSSYMDGPFSLQFLQPHNLFGLNDLNPVVHGTVWSLLLNALALVVASLYHKPSLSDREQAQRFVEIESSSMPSSIHSLRIQAEDLKTLLNRFISKQKVDALFKDFTNPITGRLIEKGNVSPDMLQAAERLLNSVLGRKGSDLLFRSMADTHSINTRDINSIMDEVSEVVTFNREILNSVLQSLNHSITVVDQNMNLIAWNKKFESLYSFPPGFLYIGLSAEHVIKYIANTGGYGKTDYEDLIQLRLNEVQARLPLHHVRKTSDNRYIEMRGESMPGGRYVTIYNDITEFRNIENELRKSNEMLEHRVGERTKELEYLNTELKKVNTNKTRFLAAAGHDLVQPLNSASLFAASISNKIDKSSTTEAEKQELTSVAVNLEKSLYAAESLLNELLEISKLDANIVKARIAAISIQDVCRGIVEEFQPLTSQKQLSLSCDEQDFIVESDPVLLRRILQNLLSNALRYTQTGGITMNIIANTGYITVEVNDTGDGIKETDLQKIFDEFHRINSNTNAAEKGLGLGLSIIQRICSLLNHPINVHSTFGKGSCFSIQIPLAVNTPAQMNITHTASSSVSNGSQHILCIDNEEQIVAGMNSLLSDWGFKVTTALTEEQARQKLETIPALVIIDYHLDNDITGVEVMDSLQSQWENTVPCLVITADYTDDVKKEAEKKGFHLLKKPVKAMALRAMINRIITD